MRDIRDFDILILPGWDNSGPDHWQTHWEQAFPNMRRVEQADWHKPVFADWSRRLSEAIERCRRPVLLVAHSLGTSLVMRWADEADSRRRRRRLPGRAHRPRPAASADPDGSRAAVSARC